MAWRGSLCSRETRGRGRWQARRGLALSIERRGSRASLAFQHRCSNRRARSGSIRVARRAGAQHAAAAVNNGKMGPQFVV
jgi:hypothetical protein